MTVSEGPGHLPPKPTAGSFAVPFAHWVLWVCDKHEPPRPLEMSKPQCHASLAWMHLEPT